MIQFETTYRRGRLAVKSATSYGKAFADLFWERAAHLTGFGDFLGACRPNYSLRALLIECPLGDTALMARKTLQWGFNAWIVDKRPDGLPDWLQVFDCEGDKRYFVSEIQSVQGVNTLADRIIAEVAACERGAVELLYRLPDCLTDPDWIPLIIEEIGQKSCCLFNAGQQGVIFEALRRETRPTGTALMPILNGLGERHLLAQVFRHTVRGSAIRLTEWPKEGSEAERDLFLLGQSQVWQAPEASLLDVWQKLVDRL